MVLNISLNERGRLRNCLLIGAVLRKIPETRFSLYVHTLGGVGKKFTEMLVIVFGKEDFRGLLLSLLYFSLLVECSTMRIYFFVIKKNFKVTKYSNSR